MKVIVEGKPIEVPAMLGSWIVQKVMPLDFLNSKWAMNHRRLSVFFHKGVQCVVPNCKCKGAFFVERACTNKHGVIMSVHVDLYTADFQLMTVDHHVPLSGNGKDKLENKFPMCERHNLQKGSLDPEIFYKRFGKSEI